MKQYTQHLQKHMQTIKDYLVAHRQDIKIATPIVIIVTALVGTIAFAALHDMPNIVYQPVKACDLLTLPEAKELLGEKLNGVDKNEPIISGETATSKCSYTDLNQNQMMVAAVAVRSGINDKGVSQNKSDFALAKSNDGNETVVGVGDSAYFTKASGQLNVLSGRKWIIISYGVGEHPEANTIEQAVKLAKIVLN